MQYFKFEKSYRIIFKQFKETQRVACILIIDFNKFIFIKSNLIYTLISLCYKSNKNLYSN